MTFERGAGRAVWTLALTQALGYACFFYIFAALLIYWQRETTMGDGVIAAGPLVATFVAAAVAPAVGRAVDRGRAVRLMVAGPVIGGVRLGSADGRRMPAPGERSQRPAGSDCLVGQVGGGVGGAGSVNPAGEK